ncbi:MAG: SpoIID/LytB domain-containing protein [Elusimicrobiota bacterium]
MKNIFLLIMVSLICASASCAQRLPGTIMRIGILINVKSFNLSCEGQYYLYEMNTGEKSEIKPMNDYLVKGEAGDIKINGKSFRSKVRINSGKSGARIRINGRRYHDNILIVCKNSKITVINELGLEDYISGILPREVSPKWPKESLKAQAVVSRTYAMKNLKRHGSESFDLCSETHCQVYGGMESEDPRTTKAVEDTRNEVLTYDGQLAQALFHACCAGHTENPNYVWIWNSNSPKYLRGRTDKFCAGSPHGYWKNRIDGEFIRKRLVKAKYDVGKIESIRISGRNESGRAINLKINHSGGTLTINAAKFRLAVDPWLVKSTMFSSIVRYGKSFEFRGSGWGHGVGMCQWGAKVMSDKGYDYKEILKYYYPGTKIEKWEE